MAERELALCAFSQLAAIFLFHLLVAKTVIAEDMLAGKPLWVVTKRVFTDWTLELLVNALVEHG